MTESRWVREPAQGEGATVVPFPACPRLEVTYLTDPEALALALPPPLRPPPEPRVHVRFTRIEVNGRLHEQVCSFLVDALYGETPGQHCLVMPIDLADAIAPSRERYGEPKKLAQLDFSRDGNHVHASVRRQGVTIIEVVGDVSRALPTPEPYDLKHFWYKFLPAVDGAGFDAGPFLVVLHQTMTPESSELVEGKLVLRDLPGTPVADLPVLEQESIRYMLTSSRFHHTLEDVEIDAAEYSKHVAVQYS
ncbi:MAG TPA: acetoacetate decarboxylase family protein [Acidimicrobiales bacterium]|jgi:acetoacetate decarboxylase|nr:acetoacetate decarboxylase family protein [Acidimicrobiales bacterium]